jgi:hypothetical protein
LLFPVGAQHAVPGANAWQCSAIVAGCLASASPLLQSIAVDARGVYLVFIRVYLCSSVVPTALLVI